TKTAAVVGGLFATLMFALMQKGFEFYLTEVGTFKSIYGAFAAVPIFLIWLYLSWALVLIGGLIAVTGSRQTRH
ncbi:MAG: YhjD/YihY/BrkB family envelope integrity protein, partial [Betaproteobacteria bacterium]